MLEIRPEPPRQPEVIALLEASDAAAQALYPPESNHLLDVSSLEKPAVRFFVARRQGVAIGCGSIVLAADGTAEIKRMFVSEQARGSGVAPALMATLEAAARAEGVTALRLETGIHSHAALRLYERHGFARRGPFADYRDDPLSVFMEKSLGKAPRPDTKGPPMTTLATLAADLLAGRVRVVDLTQTLSPDFPTIALPPQFGQCAPFRMETISRYDAAGPAWYWNNISVGEHTGTHFDAPVHWVTGKDLPNNTTDTLPPQNLIAPACVIDCSAEAANNGDYLLAPATIEAWEARHGRIPAGHWVLFRTDWSKRTGAAYSNVLEDGAHTPGPTAEAVQLLVDRGALGLGVETIGTDAGQAHLMTPMYPAHTLMHGAGRYGLQCLCNLDQLPPTGALVIAPPLKIQGGSGSPLRVLALVPA